MNSYDEKISEHDAEKILAEYGYSLEDFFIDYPQCRTDGISLRQIHRYLRLVTVPEGYKAVAISGDKQGVPEGYKAVAISGDKQGVPEGYKAVAIEVNSFNKLKNVWDDWLQLVVFLLSAWIILTGATIFICLYFYPLAAISAPSPKIDNEGVLLAKIREDYSPHCQELQGNPAPENLDVNKFIACLEDIVAEEFSDSITAGDR